MEHLHTTICALATPPGEGGIATVRVSGPDAYGIVGKIFAPVRQGKRAKSPARRSARSDCSPPARVPAPATPPQTLPAQPPAARPIARCARRRAAQIASYTNPSFALGAVPQAHFPRTNDLCNCPQGCFCARCAAIIDMKHKKTYEKQRNHLTNGRKYVTISKQSAPTVFYLKNRRTV